MIYDITPVESFESSVPRPLAYFLPDCDAGTRAFAARYGAGFLLHHGPLAPLGGRAGAQPTIFFDEQHLHRSTDVPLVVFCLRERGRSDLPGAITLGRARANDVVLGHPSVSKLHAIVHTGAEGALYLADARSHNGSFIDGVRVPAAGNGPARHLESGALVRLGAVELTFVTAEDLRALVRARLGR